MVEQVFAYKDEEGRLHSDRQEALKADLLIELVAGAKAHGFTRGDVVDMKTLEFMIGSPNKVIDILLQSEHYKDPYPGVPPEMPDTGI